jgi:hypothetical protein
VRFFSEQTPTDLALRAKGRWFKSDPAHHTYVANPLHLRCRSTLRLEDEQEVQAMYASDSA